jgi:hypothetical protein
MKKKTLVTKILKSTPHEQLKKAGFFFLILVSDLVLLVSICFKR